MPSGRSLEAYITSLQYGDTLRDLSTKTPRISHDKNDLLVSRDLPQENASAWYALQYFSCTL